MIVNGVASALPLLSSPYISFGQAVSEQMYGFASADVQHGGAIAHYGMLYLFGGSHALSFVLNVIVFSLVIAGVLVLSARTRVSPALRMAIAGSLMMIVALTMSGGNFDRSLSELITVTIQSFAIGPLLRMRLGPARRRSTEAARP
jgi:uncharacterized membrane protein